MSINVQCFSCLFLYSRGKIEDVVKARVNVLCVWHKKENLESSFIAKVRVQLLFFISRNSSKLNWGESRENGIRAKEGWG